MGIYIRDEAIVLENDYALLCVSQGDSCVQRIFDKVNGRELKGEDTCFFSLVAQDRQTVVAPTALHYSDGCITVETPLGDFRVAAAVRNGYFTFELMDALPAAAYQSLIAHAKYSYEAADKANTSAAGIAMTYWTNSCFYPDAKDRETKME